MSQIGMWGSAFVVAAAVSLAIWNALPREEANPTDPLTITSYGAEERHYGAAEMQGKRSYMEDASDVLFVPREALEALQVQQEGRAATVLPFAFFGVFDGHGGSKTSTYLRKNLLRRSFEVCKGVIASQEYSKDLISNLLATVNVKTSSSTGRVDEHDRAVEQCLVEAFVRVNAEYEEWARQHDALRWNRSGSTATVSLLYTVTLEGQEPSWRIATANAGDSRGVLGCDAPGSVVELSIDHKPNNPEEQRRIEELGGTVTRASFRSPWRVEGVLATSRSFGDFTLRPFVNAVPDVRFHSVPEGLGEQACTVLLCSDGFWDVYSNEEGHAFASKLRQAELSPKEVSERLLWTAYERMSSDNITTLVVFLDRLLPQLAHLLQEVTSMQAN